MKRMQQTVGRSYGQIFMAIAFIAIICLLGNFSRSYISPDRADNYHVKVFSMETSDAFLSKLSKDSFSYLAMIDAGSSGCRAHVYRYGKLGDITGPLYIVPQHDSKKVRHLLRPLWNSHRYLLPTIYYGYLESVFTVSTIG